MKKHTVTLIDMQHYHTAIACGSARGYQTIEMQAVMDGSCLVLLPEVEHAAELDSMPNPVVLDGPDHSDMEWCW